MPTMPIRRARPVAAALTALGCLVLTAPAFGHAVVSPPVVEPATLQVFTLSVPTERERRETTKVELTVPKGFAIDSFAPAPGWKRTVSSTGSGESAVVNKVTWSGGRTPTEEDAVFQFNATATAAKTYTFTVRQTYDDDNVVEWSGPESSDTPAPRTSPRSSRRSARARCRQRIAHGRRRLRPGAAGRGGRGHARLSPRAR